MIRSLHILLFLLYAQCILAMVQSPLLKFGLINPPRSKSANSERTWTSAKGFVCTWCVHGYNNERLIDVRSTLSCVGQQTHPVSLKRISNPHLLTVDHQVVTCKKQYSEKNPHGSLRLTQASQPRQPTFLSPTFHKLSIDTHFVEEQALPNQCFLKVEMIKLNL